MVVQSSQRNSRLEGLLYNPILKNLEEDQVNKNQALLLIQLARLLSTRPLPTVKGKNSQFPARQQGQFPPNQFAGQQGQFQPFMPPADDVVPPMPPADDAVVPDIVPPPTGSEDDECIQPPYEPPAVMEAAQPPTPAPPEGAEGCG